MTYTLKTTRGIPSVFSPSIFDELFKAQDDIFGAYKSSIPYNVTEDYDDNGNVKATDIQIALAGYDKGDIKVRIVEDELQIDIGKASAATNENKKIVHKGISEKSVQLRFKLAGVCDKSNIKSTFKNGLLNVNIPSKAEETINISID